MFDLGITEIMVIAVVAIVAIGPKQLPDALVLAGRWIGKFRSTMRSVRSGFDDIVREAELKDLEKKWADENARIMREHPEGALSAEEDAGEMRPLPPPPAAEDAESESADPENQDKPAS